MSGPGWGETAIRSDRLHLDDHHRRHPTAPSVGTSITGGLPTYTLGNMYAAQLFAAARNELTGLDGQFARGDSRSLLDWLRQRIH
jgi:hypothetical protein